MLITVVFTWDGFLFCDPCSRLRFFPVETVIPERLRPPPTFRSVLASLSHLLWADQIFLSIGNFLPFPLVFFGIFW